MWWIALWASVAAIGLAGTVASVNSLRFNRRVDREVRTLATAARSGSAAVDRVWMAGLPAPVQRYSAKALGGRTHPIERVRLRHSGTFRPTLDGSWLPIRGEQYFTADPPAFIWWGRVRLVPGIWIDARDRSVNGSGNMWVTMESTITLANSSGDELDQGALLRLLGEMPWFPTALLDRRYVTWRAVDDRRAIAALTVNGRSVSGEFVFGPDDLPSAFHAERYRDVGGGRSVLTPFVGRLTDFRSVDGVLVPYRVIGAWTVEGQTKEYANFEIERVEFNWREPY
jgi:hypothetical protein